MGFFLSTSVLAMFLDSVGARGQNKIVLTAVSRVAKSTKRIAYISVATTHSLCADCLHSLSYFSADVFLTIESLNR